jgi:hypothetical protein
VATLHGDHETVAESVKGTGAEGVKGTVESKAVEKREDNTEIRQNWGAPFCVHHSSDYNNSSNTTFCCLM